MERKKKVMTPQGEVDATEIGYRTSGEFWNEYLMDDGSVVRMKVVVTSIVRVDGQYDEQNNPMYLIQSSPVVAVSAPDNLRKQ